MKHKKITFKTTQKILLLSYLMIMSILAYQNCGPGFVANSNEGLYSYMAGVMQGSDIISPMNSNIYKPQQNLSFTFKKNLVPNGTVIWSHLLNSTSSCTEVSSNDSDPYIVNCAGKGVLTVSLLINTGTDIIGPLRTNVIVNDGVPRTDKLVSYLIKNTTGDWNTQGIARPAPTPYYGIISARKMDTNVRPNVPIKGAMNIRYNPDLLMANESKPTWTFSSASGICTPSVGVTNVQTFDFTCTANESSIDISLVINISDPKAGAYQIPKVTWHGSYDLASDTFTITDYGPSFSSALGVKIAANSSGVTFTPDQNALLQSLILANPGGAVATPTFGTLINSGSCTTSGSGALTLSCTTDANVFVYTIYNVTDNQLGTLIPPQRVTTVNYNAAAKQYTFETRMNGVLFVDKVAPLAISANYIGSQELLSTNIVFVGQTLRFFNKASSSKAFALDASAPCETQITTAIPYTTTDDYSSFTDCKITKEFGDTDIGSAITNRFDSSQKFYLIALDGTRLYNNNCKACHLDLSIARNQIGNETLSRLEEALQGKANSDPMMRYDNSYGNHLRNLTDAEKLAIIFALKN